MNNQNNFPRIKKFFSWRDYSSVRRGDIYYADLSQTTVGSEQGGRRPVLILQNNKGNLHSPTVIVAAITSQNKRGLPTHVELKDGTYGLSKNSTIMMEQIRTIDKTRLGDRIGHLDKEVMAKINKAIFVSFGIDVDLLNQSPNKIAEESVKSEEKTNKSAAFGRMIAKGRHRILKKMKYNLEELLMKEQRGMKLKKINVSVDGEKVKARVVELWSKATPEAKRKVKKLAGPNVYRTIEKSHNNGNVSEGAAIAFAWGYDVSPFYVTGASDERGEFTLNLLAEFLRKQRYDRGFIERYSKYLLSLENVTVESSSEPVIAPPIAEVTAASEPPAIIPQEVSADSSAARVNELLVAKPGGLETQSVVDNLTEEEVVILTRALLIRSKVHNSNVAELAAQIKTLLILN